jgi:peptide/nickel transport system substrate-binding protein
MGSDGFFEKNGQELTITAQVISGYTDYVQDLDIIQAEEKAAGINFVVDGESYAQFTSAQDTGNFQLLIDNFGYTPSPYVFFDNLLNGSAVLPIGQIETVGDFGRYNNPTIDSLLDSIGASGNISNQKKDFYRIEEIFKANLPLIPIFDQQDEQEFNGSVVTGEPTLSNPYAASAIYIAPDLGWVAMNIAPSS